MDITISGDTDSEFLECVDDILRNREFRKLVCYKQHFNTTRFLHCLNVSYIFLAPGKKIPALDARTAARAGLLHDFCPYDFKEPVPTAESIRPFYHPQGGCLQTARPISRLLKRSMRPFCPHMFPLGPIPTSREAWIITLRRQTLRHSGTLPDAHCHGQTRKGKDPRCLIRSVVLRTSQKASCRDPHFADPDRTPSSVKGSCQGQFQFPVYN